MGVDSRVCQGKNLVFIVGCPRSGTTWLLRLLASHPRVRPGLETNLFRRYIGPELRAWRREVDRLNKIASGKLRVRAYGLPYFLTEIEFLNALRDHTLALMRPLLVNLRSDELLLEKTPDHALFLPEISQVLPQARIIHIIRDPRDVVASVLSLSRDIGLDWAPKNPRVAARMWVASVKSVREGAKSLTKQQFFETRFEDLLESTLDELRRLSNFLELEWEPEVLEAAISKNTAHAGKEEQGSNLGRAGGEAARLAGEAARIGPPRVIRKGKAGGWKDDLSATEKFWVWWVARKEMDLSGYHWARPW